MDQEQMIRLDEINIRIIIKDLLWHLPYIILAVFIGVMGVRIYKNMVYVPEYTASTTMAVMAKGNADGSAYSSLTTASSMAEVFTEVFQSEIMREKVKDTVGEISGDFKITTNLIQETNLLVLNVTANDPQTAYKVILSIIENYRYVSDYLFSNAVLEVIMEPVVPMAPSNSFNTSRLDKLAVLAMFVLICGLIVVCSVFRKTVKTVKAGRRNLEGRYLGVIPYEAKNRTLKAKIKRTNKALVIGSNVLNFRYEESFQHIAGRLQHIMDKDHKKIVLVTSVAENEGKSTVAVNLATSLARRNKKVLLIDLDFRKPAVHKIIDDEDNGQGANFCDCLQNGDSIENYIKYDKKQDIYVILNAKKKRFNDKVAYENAIKTKVNEMLELFDYVIVDSAPISAGTDTEYLNEFSQCSVIVVRQDYVDTADINDSVEMLKEGKSEFLGYILNAFNDVKSNGKRYSGYSKYSYEQEN